MIVSDLLNPPGTYLSINSFIYLLTHSLFIYLITYKLFGFVVVLFLNTCLGLDSATFSKMRIWLFRLKYVMYRSSFIILYTGPDMSVTMHVLWKRLVCFKIACQWYICFHFKRYLLISAEQFACFIFDKTFVLYEFCSVRLKAGV